MKKRKSFISVIAILVVVVFIITFIASAFPIHAVTLEEQRQKAREGKNAAEQELSSIKSQLKTAEADRDNLNNEISELSSKIDEVQADINATDIKLAEKEAELASAEAACEQQFSSFKTRARVMYENGPSTYVEMLFSSGSFSEFLSNVEIISNLLDYDERVLNERKAVREEIATQKEEVEAVKAEQELKRETLTEMRSTLNIKKASLDTTISKLNSQKKVTETKRNDFALQEANFQNRINSAKTAQNTTSSGSGTKVAAATFSGTASGNEAVRIAKSYIGVPYVWGGTTPKGFDCSGFVQYVYRQMGISINRVAADQANNGYYVAKEDLQPGDLVFFKKAGRAIHHVGMYVGNGQYIHAPSTGRTICIENMTRSDYYTARRIV